MRTFKKISSGLLVAGLSLYALSALAWTGPPAAPPTCPAGSAGCDAPLNVSAAAQTKSGLLGLSSGLNVTGKFNLTGPTADWAEVINWPPAGSNYGILVGGVYSQFQNPSGYYALLGYGGWGLYTNGSAYAAGSISAGSATLATNGDLYMPWKGQWLSTALSHAMTNPDGRIGNWNVGNGYIQVVLDGALYGISIWASDSKYKSNIEPATRSALADIEKIEFKSFQHNLEHKNWDIGVIAQNLQKIDKNYVNTMSDGTLNPDIPRLLTLGLKASQELNTQLNIVEKENTELKNQIADLLKRVGDLENKK